MNPARTLKHAAKLFRISPEVARSYEVRFETIAKLDDDDDTNVVLMVHGKITRVTNEDDTAPVGEFQGMCVRWRRCRESLFDICDTSPELSEFTSLVWDHETSGYRTELGLDADIGGDLIVPLTMEILPAHRGKGVGLLVLWRFLDYFGDSAAIAVLKPYPLNHNREAARKENYLPMQYDQLSKVPVKKGIEKIGQHWKRLGFKPVPKSWLAGRLDDDDYLYLDMSSTLPSLSDLKLIARSS